jgi:histidinol phosphatase-like enzyme
MSEQFLNEKAHVDEVFVATELNNKDSRRRKPNLEMGLEAKMKFPNVDFEKSIMIGDTDSDISFGQNLGMKTVLIESEQNCQSSPDLKLDSLADLNKILS